MAWTRSVGKSSKTKLRGGGVATPALLRTVMAGGSSRQSRLRHVLSGFFCVDALGKPQ